LNVLDAASVKLLAVTSHANETAAFLRVFRGAAASTQTDVSHLQLTLTDVRTAIRVLNPAAKTDIDKLPFDIGFHWGTHGTTYICLKKAFAAWYALEALGLHHVMVTDSEAYIWKPIFMHEIFKQQARNATIWYSDDGPAPHQPGVTMPGEPSNMRVNFCSMLPWTGAKVWGLAPSGTPGHELDSVEYSSRLQRIEYWRNWRMRMSWHAGAVPEMASRLHHNVNLTHATPPRGVRVDWGTWKRIVADKLPSPYANMMDYHGFFYHKHGFAAYRAHVEAAWQLPFLDAVMQALSRNPTCDSDAFWIETSWQSFLYNHERARHRFRNATALIQAEFPRNLANASPVIKRLGFFPAGFNLLWWFLDNSTLPSLKAVYERYALPHFRNDFRGTSLRRGSKDSSCFGLKLINSLPAPLASIQLNSATPNWLWQACGHMLPNRSLPSIRHRVIT